MTAALVVLGCGFAGTAVARRARGRRIAATVRDPAHARALVAEGIEAHAGLSPEDTLRCVPDGADVLVAFPPDATSDARLAAGLTHARALVYVSTTGVYGAARGHVDEDTPVDPSAGVRVTQRLEAERVWRAAGAVVLRAAGIYGPGRGLHERVARGDHRIPGDGSNVVSRVHVHDLATLVLAALDRAPRGAVYVVADDTPVPQIEAIAWLCARLGLAMPPHVALDEAPETLRHDRRVDNARIRRDLGVALAYPSYREGFAACLASRPVGDGSG